MCTRKLHPTTQSETVMKIKILKNMRGGRLNELMNQRRGTIKHLKLNSFSQWISNWGHGSLNGAFLQCVRDQNMRQVFKI